MYIKQVIIQGFRSYREQIIVDPFDSRHNVVVGRNGSGKSNFFYAIQFVLSDEFSHLRPEERQALLHEGNGPRVVSAFVEIIFDNTDNRLPIEKEEVVLRRVIGSKKDQYFLDKKLTTRTEVMNLLESAGFSRSNPYYIVKQGKINQMAIAPDSQRLQLLREVAGTRVYDERREESKGVLKDAEGKREKIEGLLKSIEERLKTLEEEKEELKEYQKWDKMRRALDYAIHDHELKDIRKKLEVLKTKVEDSSSVTKKLREQLKKAKDNIKQRAKELRVVESKLETFREEKEQLTSEQQGLLEEKTKLELKIKDLKDEVEGNSSSNERAAKELEKLQETICQKKTLLEELKPQYEQQKKREEECTRELALKQQKRKELYAKLGRGSKYTSKEERDTWIQKELEFLERAIKDKKEQIAKLEEELKNDEKKRETLNNKIKERNDEIETHRNRINERSKTCCDMKKRKDALQTERKEFWRQENVMQQNLSQLKEELAKQEQGLRFKTGKSILNGRDSVNKVLNTFRERGDSSAEITNKYYGLLIDSFECDKTIYTAVEVTAGNKLFYHVVESDDIGSQILKEMNRQRLPGEVTFMPLNRIYDRVVQYPQTNDAIPMFTKLTFEPKFEKAIKFIFGKTLICRNLEIATQLARKSGLDCVTLEGDQVGYSGALTGGYYDSRRSRLAMQKLCTQLFEDTQKQERELQEHREKLSSIETEINNVVSSMQKAETKSSKTKDVCDKLKADVRLMEEERDAIERSRNSKERSVGNLNSSLKAMESTVESYRSELQEELLSQLTDGDQLEVKTLNDDIKRLTRENKEAFGERMRLEAEKNKLENLLNNNLMRKKDELEAGLKEMSVEDCKRNLENSNTELIDINEKITHVNSSLEEIESRLEKYEDKQKTAQRELEKLENQKKEFMEKLNDDAKELAKLKSKQSVLLKKEEDCLRKIRELGSLPSNAFDKYSHLSLKQLFKQLEQCNHELKKYSHVNKKALDQFINFSDMKENLMKRKEELDRGHQSITELLSTLEQRKYEAIQFTFKQVSKYFSQVFKKLVPQGNATLIIKNVDQEEASGSQESQSVPNVEQFAGVGIKVSFTGKSAEMRQMQQLSGGQKSLVALALIFAIQKCDPAPFYLFDEIDQALDAQHRGAVADMIHELSKDAQFITTTFKPELLEKADKFYGVWFRNKVSHIECVPREQAREFLEDDQTRG